MLLQHCCALFTEASPSPNISIASQHCFTRLVRLSPAFIVSSATASARCHLKFRIFWGVCPSSRLYRHTESRQEGAFCPLVCPPPRGDTSHGPGSGEGLKREPARGFPLPNTVFLGYRLTAPLREGAGGGGGVPACETRQVRGNLAKPRATTHFV